MHRNDFEFNKKTSLEKMQILKPSEEKTKKAKDVSAKMFMIQILAYISLIIYTTGTSLDVILLIYYITGLIQNIIICLLKKKYDSLISQTSIEDE